MHGFAARFRRHVPEGALYLRDQREKARFEDLEHDLRGLEPGIRDFLQLGVELGVDSDPVDRHPHGIGRHLQFTAEAIDQ